VRKVVRHSLQRDDPRVDTIVRDALPTTTLP
jgi:hypothetical protein